MGRGHVIPAEGGTGAEEIELRDGDVSQLRERVFERLAQHAVWWTVEVVHQRKLQCNTTRQCRVEQQASSRYRIPNLSRHVTAFVRSFVRRSFVRFSFVHFGNVPLPKFTCHGLVIFRPLTFYPYTTWKYTAISLYYSPPLTEKWCFYIKVGHMKRTYVILAH